MIKVAVDKGPLTSGHAVRGVGVYTRELIKALQISRDKDIKIFEADFETADLTKYDLVHYTYFNPFFLTLPFAKPAVTVVTIHDLIPLIYPKHYPPGFKGRLKFQIQKYLLRNVDGVIAPSETSKKDIVRFLGVPAERIKVIYEAPREIFKKLRNEELKNIKNKYNLPERFVLYVGDVNYNKNIMGLIEACKIAKVPLVICGKQALEIEELGLGLDVLRGPMDWFRFLFNIPHPELAHFEDTLDEFQTNKKIIRLGFVPDEDLIAIYNLATVYCQPSFYEGFGLPVLESMACSTPVVAAKTQALVEIAEDSALFANPNKPGDIADKILGLIKSPKLKKEFTEKGKEKAASFSWDKTARETAELYDRILGI